MAIVPILVGAIWLTGLLTGTDLFAAFCKGASNAFQTAVAMLPALVGLVVAVRVFSASGALDLLTAALRPVAALLHFPVEVLPLALLRPLSGGGALAMFRELLTTYGADSFVGRVASVLQGSTETTCYTIALYYGATRIKNTRHTLAASLTGDVVGFLASALVVGWWFGR